jgi:hypothetical protein
MELYSKSTLIYDCETINCIPIGEYNPDFQYCKSRDDFKGMGLSVIGAYASWTGRYHVFLNDNLYDFRDLIKQAERIVGFNSLAFDDKLCWANDIQIKTNYDLLCEVRVAAGMPPHYVKGVTRKGYSLNDLAQANLNIEKTGSGAIAPQLWQKGDKGKVIDYCLNDVMLLKELYQQRKQIIDPTNQNLLYLRD